MTSRVECVARSATLLPALLAGALPALVHAHPGSGLGLDGAGVGLGFAHPWSGLDHVLAMLAVGLWAGQLGGRARLGLPLCFLALVACGGALAVGGVALAGVELGSVLSALALGLLIAGGVRFPLLAGALVVGGFAVFHGHAHGNEMSASASPLGQLLGFLAATALLHALGLAASSGVLREPLVRTSGAAIALGGLWLLWSAAV